MNQYLLVHKRHLRPSRFHGWDDVMAEGLIVAVVRPSPVPTYATMAGSILLALAGLVTLAGALVTDVNWTNLLWVMFAGFALVLPELVMDWTGWRLCVILRKRGLYQ